MANGKLLWALLVGGGLLASALGGCEIDNKCGSSLVYRDRACMPPLAPDAAVVPPVASVDTGMGLADLAGIAQPDTEGTLPVDTEGAGMEFGATCKSNADCTGKTSYCALQPGQPTGYCTAIGCDKIPMICPPGWNCLQFFTSPYFCMKP